MDHEGELHIEVTREDSRLSIREEDSGTRKATATLLCEEEKNYQRAEETSHKQSEEEVPPWQTSSIRHDNPGYPSDWEHADKSRSHFKETRSIDYVAILVDDL